MNTFQLRLIQREREKLALSIFDSMPDMIVFKDHNGRWLKANKLVIDNCKLHGFNYIGKHDAELAQYSEFKEAFLNCAESDLIAWKKRKTLILEEIVGDKFLRVKKIPVFKENGDRKGIIVISRDISDEKRIEEKIIEDFESFSFSIID